MLAELYQRSGQWPKYLRSMRGVMGNGGANIVQYVRAYAEALTEHGEVSEGKIWLDRLKSLAAGKLSTATVEANLLLRAGDYPRLLALLTRTSSDTEHRTWATQAAEVYAMKLQRAGKAAEAEQLWDLEMLASQTVEQQSSAARAPASAVDLGRLPFLRRHAHRLTLPNRRWPVVGRSDQRIPVQGRRRASPFARLATARRTRRSTADRLVLPRRMASGVKTHLRRMGRYSAV